jgi:hypothetical protein
LELYQKYDGEQLGPVINQITLNLGNFHQVLQQGLYNHAPDLGITIHSISSLDSFYRITGRGCTGLLDSILPILPGLDDPQLQLHFIIEVLKSSAYYPSLDKEQFIKQAPNMIEHINNPLLECKCTSSVSYYLAYMTISQANSFLQQGYTFYSLNRIYVKLCNSMKRHWTYQGCVEIPMSSVVFC